MTGMNDTKIEAKLELDPKYLEGMLEAYRDIHSIMGRMANRYPANDERNKIYSGMGKEIRERSAIVERTIRDIIC